MVWANFKLGFAGDDLAGGDGGAGGEAGGFFQPGAGAVNGLLAATFPVVFDAKHAGAEGFDVEGNVSIEFGAQLERLGKDHGGRADLETGIADVARDAVGANEKKELDKDGQ